jgi:hypothetical protein
MASTQSLLLANSHRDTLTDVTTLTQQEVLSFLDFSVNYDAPDYKDLIKSGLPNIIIPYTEVTRGLSETYYDDLRIIAQMEQGLKWDNPTYKPFELDLTKQLMYILINVGVDIIVNNRFGIRDKIVDFVTTMVKKVIFSASRETIDKRGTQDKRRKRTTRVAQPGACAYCIAGTMVWLDPTPTGDFHDDCRCVNATYFEGDKQDKYITEYQETFEKDYKKAGEYIKQEKAFENSVEEKKTSDDLFFNKKNGRYRYDTNLTYTYMSEGEEFKRKRYFNTFESYLEVMRSEYGYR